MVQPVWIDTDCGFDDLAAIAMVTADTNWRIVGMGIVAGNVPLDIAVSNSARMKSFFRWAMPIYAGCKKPLIGSLVTSQHILGPDGIPTVARRLPDADIQIEPIGAVEGLVQALALTKEKLTILALGPLTNIAVTLLARPDLADRITEVVWLGGAATGGNHTACAEYNAYADPEALAILLESNISLRVIGLDCGRQVTVTVMDAYKIRGLETERARILADLLEGYVRIASVDGNRPMPLYDAVAAAALLDPRAVAFIPAHMQVELSGKLTRGMTVCELRANKAVPNVALARSALATRVIDRLLNILTDTASSDMEVRVN